MREDTRDAILEAAIETMTLYGLSRLTLADVAKQAKLSRQTLYRYFPTRDDLIAAAVVREEQALIELVEAAAAPIERLDDALEIALVTTVRAAAEHPLLQRLIEVEPEGLVPFLMSEAAPVLGAARPALTALIMQRRADLDPGAARFAADSLTRLLVSWIVNPPDTDVEAHATQCAAFVHAGLESTINV